jgi:molybdenum cofactor guanylyltransferase
MEHPAQRDLTAFVLTGGKSERMGRDKASLETSSGLTLLENALALAAAVAGEARLVGSKSNYSRLAWAGQIVEDIYPGQGPLAGIHAALVSSSTEMNLIFGVDMPLLTTPLLEFIVAKAREHGAEVTLARAGGRLQTLCAVYSRSFAAVAEEALSNNRNKIDALFPLVSVRVIEEEELTAAGFAPELFENVNTPAEYERIVQGKIP